MRLYLLRHGQTHANVSGALDTAHPGLELTDLGQQQARAAARELDGAGIDAIAVSTLTRTSQTARPLADVSGLTPTVHDGLREISAGDFEMCSDQVSVHAFLETIGAWLDGDLDRVMPGGETGTGFLARYDEAIAEICTGNPASALVVSHGAAIRTWVTHRATGEHAPVHEGLHNTGCVTLDGSPEDGWVIVSWQREPIGGARLDDVTAPDPTGDEL
ncbi:histidine phosphatase family protein [Nocardioides sp.]|uniref:histidine phosphatase family protein n=1 Tax=Nocardioides sp. TaxID=35761 RepID=UPI002C6A19E0|nr:histidine phosphatase family protein [Nocardioides sp.]HXH78115.1 histidine phosphatase family protein [Nocardioides sp.]